MAEAKLKEIIEAYNALTGKTDVSATPAPPEPPEILSPVPEHIIDKNAPLPVFLPEAFVPAEPGQPIEEPPETARPLSDWEKERPASYPKPEPAAPPTIQFAPPPVPARPKAVLFAAQFGAFLIPVLLAVLGLLLYDSGSSRPEHRDQLAPGSAAKKPVAQPEARPTPHAATKKAAQPNAAAEAAPIVLPNGAQLTAPGGPRGAGRFRIANRSGQDAVVRVVSQEAPGTPLRQVYVQDGTEVPIEGIGTGVYLVYISLGPVNKAPRKYGRALGPFQFMQVESVEGPQSDDYQLVLKPTQ